MYSFGNDHAAKLGKMLKLTTSFYDKDSCKGEQLYVIPLNLPKQKG